jgi:hypothetical protein
LDYVNERIQKIKDVTAVHRVVPGKEEHALL